MKGASDPERESRTLLRQRQIIQKLRKAAALETAARREVDRLIHVALDAEIPAPAVVAAVDEFRAVKVYVERAPGDTERDAARRALCAVRGRIVSVTQRKLRDGRDCAPQGRPGPSGDLGVPVWRVEIERGAS